MANLNESIDAAIKEQYPNDKPTIYQTSVKKSDRDRWVEHFDLQLRSHSIIAKQEHRFHPVRMWRFDFAILESKLAIEIDGGGFGRSVICHRCKAPVIKYLANGGSYTVREGGGHNTGKAMERDNEKLNTAVAMGWKVLRFTPSAIKDHTAIDLVCSILGKS